MKRPLVPIFTCLTLICSFMGLTNLLEAGPWQIHLIVLPVLITGCMWVVMAVWSSRAPVLSGFTATILSLQLWVCYLCGAATEGKMILPVPSALEALLDSLIAGVYALPKYTRPAPHPELFLTLSLLGLGLIAMVAVFWAVVAKMPLWVGLPVALTWTLFLVAEPGRGLGWVIATAAAYLLLITVSKRKSLVPTRLRPEAMGIVALAVILSVFSTLVIPLIPGWGKAYDWDNPFGPPRTDNTGIAVTGTFSVSDDLHKESATVHFRSFGDYAGPWKVGSLNLFTGRDWRAFEKPYRMDYTEGRLIWDWYEAWLDDEGFEQWGMVSPPPAWSEGPTAEINLAHGPAAGLPNSVGPRWVRTDEYFGLVFDISYDALFETRELTADDSYTVGTMVLDRSALTWPLPYPMNLVDQEAGAHIDEIITLTEEIVGDAKTQDQALTAIQTYLRSSRFTYTLTPRWDSAQDPVWDFLRNKEGYCTHFATAMAVMGMSIGIQMRVSVGYLGGQLDSDGWRTVRGAQAHMWPEAFFPDVGWVRYEPTPAVNTTGWVDGPSGADPSQDPTADDTPTDGTPTGPQPDPTQVPDPGQAAENQGWVWLRNAGIAVVGAGLLVLGGWVMWIRTLTEERTWRAIRKAGLKSQRLTDGMTIRTAVASLVPLIDEETTSQLIALRDALEHQRYAQPGLHHPRIKPAALWKLRRNILRRLT